MAAPKSLSLKHRHLLKLSLQVEAKDASIIGSTPKGYRTIVPVVSGRFEGERLSGRVLGGTDWVLTQGPDAMEIDVRLTLETEDKACIYLTYQGRFRGVPGSLARLSKGDVIPEGDFSLAMIARLECGDPRYDWLNHVIAVGTGSQSGFNPTYQIFEVG